MCKVLKVSESGYYRWLKNGSKPRSWQLLLVEINKIFTEHPDNDNYGVERVKTALGLKGIKASKSKIYRAMKAGGLIHRCRKSHGITKADTETQDRETEVMCSYGKLYVSAILDCFNGEILALEMRDNMKKELCIDTLKQLKSKYGDISGAIFYSDRGCQYTSYAFKTVHHFWFMDSALKS